MTPYQEYDPHFPAPAQALKETTHTFARDVLRPLAMQIDQISDPAVALAPGSPFWEGLRQSYARGLHGLLIPKEAGGLGLAGLELHVVLEELSWGSVDFAASIVVAGFPFSAVATLGGPALVEELVKPFAADRNARSVGCWALTEPDHGSDQFWVDTPQAHDPKMSGQVTARPDRDQYVLNGRKASWISNGTIATHALVYLNLDPSKGVSGGGVAFVPLDLPGVVKEPPLDKLGQRALNQGGFIFNDVRIPKRYLLADDSIYEAVLRTTLVATNAAMGALFTGVARAACEEALAYCKTRRQGGKSLAEHQLVQKRLFDMFMKVSAARALSRAAMVRNQAGGAPALEYAIAAKIFCTQAAFEVADSAVQLLGGRGLVKGCLVEKLFRDARASLIEDGSNDILALIGAGRILGAGDTGQA